MAGGGSLAYLLRKNVREAGAIHDVDAAGASSHDVQRSPGEGGGARSGGGGRGAWGLPGGQSKNALSARARAGRDKRLAQTD